MVFTVRSFETSSIRTHSCHPEGAFRPKDLSDSPNLQSARTALAIVFPDIFVRRKPHTLPL
jgi:hypothetical protein